MLRGSYDCMVNNNNFCSSIKFQYGLIDLLVCLLISFRWTQQLSPKLWCLFLFLYLCEILVLIIYLREWESHWKVSGLLPRAGKTPGLRTQGKQNQKFIGPVGNVQLALKQSCECKQKCQLVICSQKLFQNFQDCRISSPLS